MADHPSQASSLMDEMLIKCSQMMQAYWEQNPDLFNIVQKNKQQAETAKANQPNITDQDHARAVSDNTVPDDQHSCLLPMIEMPLHGKALREKIHASNLQIHQQALEAGALISPRIQAHNRKSAAQSLDEERDFRADIVSEQIRAWRSILPNVIRKFSKIPDYRRVSSVKHKITVLMIFGLFAFIFRLSSRREMNRELTSPVIFNHLKKIFPELESIPHADTLARALENINPHEIEKIHISLVKDLINKKKFKSMLVQGCVPIAIDGTQKLYRQDQWHNERWCERKVGDSESDDMQQYVYVLEANINCNYSPHNSTFPDSAI
jgi:hypothetical protein